MVTTEFHQHKGRARLRQRTNHETCGEWREESDAKRAHLAVHGARAAGMGAAHVRVRLWRELRASMVARTAEREMGAAGASHREKGRNDEFGSVGNPEISDGKNGLQQS